MKFYNLILSTLVLIGTFSIQGHAAVSSKACNLAKNNNGENSRHLNTNPVNYRAELKKLSSGKTVQ